MVLTIKNIQSRIFDVEFETVIPNAFFIIRNILGHKVRETEISEKKINVDLNNYPQGAYFFQVDSELESDCYSTKVIVE